MTGALLRNAINVQYSLGHYMYNDSAIPHNALFSKNSKVITNVGNCNTLCL